MKQIIKLDKKKENLENILFNNVEKKRLGK